MGGDAELVQKRRAPDSAGQPAPWGNQDWSGGDLDASDLAQATNQLEVLHHRYGRKTPDPVILVGTHEHRLIAIGQPEDPATQIHQSLDGAQGPSGVGAVNSQAKGAGGNPWLGEDLLHVVGVCRGQQAIRMQEEEPISPRRPGAAVELNAPPGRRGQDRRAVGLCDRGGVITALSIHDDDLVWVTCQCVVDRFANAPLLVERGNDDRESHLRNRRMKSNSFRTRGVRRVRL